MNQDSCDDEDEDPAPQSVTVEPSKRSCWKRPTTWNVVFNGILAITTILLGLIAYGQLKSSHVDQRAWVGPTSFIHPGGGPEFIKEGSQPSFGVVIANAGKTPARKIHVMIQRSTLQKGVSFDAVYNDQGGPSSTSVLFPGQTFNLTTNPEPHPLTAKQVEIITTGEFTLYLYGVITYEDVFEVKHQTTFCGFLATDLTSFKTCSTYNQVN